MSVEAKHINQLVEYNNGRFGFLQSVDFDTNQAEVRIPLTPILRMPISHLNPANALPSYFCINLRENGDAAELTTLLKPLGYTLDDSADHTTPDYLVGSCGELSFTMFPPNACLELHVGDLRNIIEARQQQGLDATVSEAELHGASCDANLPIAPETPSDGTVTAWRELEFTEAMLLVRDGQEVQYKLSNYKVWGGNVQELNSLGIFDPKTRFRTEPTVQLDGKALTEKQAHAFIADYFDQQRSLV